MVLWLISLVDPAVAEVVLVKALRLGADELEVTELDLGRLEGGAIGLVALVELGGAEGEAADDELVEVGVGPAEGGLEDLVELGESEIEGQQEKPSPGAGASGVRIRAASSR